MIRSAKITVNLGIKLTMIVTLAGSKDALVVMGELDQVYTISLTVICVHFLSSL